MPVGAMNSNTSGHWRAALREERVDNEDECEQNRPGDCFVKVACRTGTAPNKGMDLLLPLVLLEGGAARETR